MNDLMCRCSFIVPVYNVKSDYLSCCIRSILDINSNDIELILVDDYSTNGCELLCDNYALKDKRVKVFHNKRNLGVSASRNLGIESCSGEWIVFVDSDDWVESTMYEILLKYMSNDIDVIMFSAYQECLNGTREFGTTESIIRYDNNTEKNTIQVLKENLLKQCLKSTPPMFDILKYCWGKSFNRSFLESHNILFSKLGYCEDIVYMNDILNKAQTVLSIPNRLYHYRVVEGSTVHSFRLNILADQTMFINLMQSRSTDDTVYFAALLSMQICITRYFYNRENPTPFFKRIIDAQKMFSLWPYSKIFDVVDCRKMKKTERIKGFLLKYKMYFLYYLATEFRKKKTLRFK